jgi:sulfate transport system permease protein
MMEGSGRKRIPAMSNAHIVGEARGVRWLLIGLALAFLAATLVGPLVLLFAEAFAQGMPAYLTALATPDTRSAIFLTLRVAAVVVPLNAVFGIVAAWCIAKFDFPGKAWLVTAIDLPVSVSPVIVGLVFVLIFGARGWLGPVLMAHGIKVIFAVPGLIIVTLFVTIAFVARQLIPLMEQQGRDEEEAAIVLGATGLQTFFYVTLPNIRWALVYGILLSNARAMGEFGAVAVVSGQIRGATMTMPLQVLSLYQDYDSIGAFAVASLLALLALVTLAVRRLLEGRYGEELGHVGTH